MRRQPWGSAASWPSPARTGAAGATVFFTAVVNHALHAERFDLLPWASLGLADNPVYDRGGTAQAGPLGDVL